MPGTRLPYSGQVAASCEAHPNGHLTPSSELLLERGDASLLHLIQLVHRPPEVLVVGLFCGLQVPLVRGITSLALAGLLAAEASGPSLPALLCRTASLVNEEPQLRLVLLASRGGRTGARRGRSIEGVGRLAPTRRGLSVEAARARDRVGTTGSILDLRRVGLRPLRTRPRLRSPRPQGIGRGDDLAVLARGVSVHPALVVYPLAVSEVEPLQRERRRDLLLAHVPDIAGVGARQGVRNRPARRLGRGIREQFPEHVVLGIV
jgi:hypothetical protein